MIRMNTEILLCLKQDKEIGAHHMSHMKREIAIYLEPYRPHYY
jgi:hypothetical protein